MANTGGHSFSGAQLEEISQKAFTIWTTISIFQDANLTDIFIRASIKTAENFLLNQLGMSCQSNKSVFHFKAM